MIFSAQESFIEWRHSLARHPARYGMILFLAFGVGVFLIGPMMAYLAQPPTVTIVAQTKLADVSASGGGVLGLLINTDRPPSCTGEIRRALWRIKPGSNPPYKEIYNFDWRAKGDPFPNENRYQLDLPITAKLAAGDWHYSSFYTRKCSLLEYWFPNLMRQTSDIPVPLENP